MPSIFIWFASLVPKASPIRPLILIAWLLLAAVAFVTLSPIGLRPVSSMPANFERFAAFAALGLAFGLAYPRHFWLVMALVIVSAVAFEAGQLLVQGRHGRLLDLFVKFAGTLAGGGAAHALRLVQAKRNA